MTGWLSLADDVGVVGRTALKECAPGPNYGGTTEKHQRLGLCDNSPQREVSMASSTSDPIAYISGVLPHTPFYATELFL